jgi:formylglycine-generating enzyme required for sulfatase activity
LRTEPEEFGELEQDFIEEGQKAEDRRAARRQQRFTWSAALLSLVFIVLAVWALLSWREAQQNAILAANREVEAKTAEAEARHAQATAVAARATAQSNAALGRAQLDRQAGLALLQEAYAMKRKGDARGAVEKLRAAKATKTDLGIDVEAEIEDVRRQVATRLVQEGEALAKGGDFSAAEAKFRAALALEPPPDTPVYVYVPAGPFFMGEGEISAFTDILHAYWIQRIEVTNAQYRRCVEARESGEQDGCEPPHDGNIRYRNPQFAKQPVAGITWSQAQAYATWMGGRLPTEAEWEKACRGGLEIPEDPLVGWGKTKGNDHADRLYPWGNQDPTEEWLNSRETGLGTWSAVGSYPDGASPYGAFDLAGNVYEWTSSAYAAYPYNPGDGREGPDTSTRVMRGGSFANNADNMLCTFRLKLSPDVRYDNYGFRVVVSPGF